jgi:hypothetical protein
MCILCTLGEGRETHLSTFRRVEKGGGGFLKKYCPKGFASPEAELRFCPWLLMFKLFSLFPFCESLVMTNEWVMALFWPIASWHFLRYTKENETAEKGDTEGPPSGQGDLRFFTLGKLTKELQYRRCYITVYFAMVASKNIFRICMLSLVKKTDILQKMKKALDIYYFNLLSQNSRDKRSIYDTFIELCKQRFVM